MGSWAQTPTSEPRADAPSAAIASDHGSAAAAPSARKAKRIRRFLTLALVAPGAWGLIALTLGETLWVPALMREGASHVLPAMAIAATIALGTRRYVSALLNVVALVLCLTILVGPRAPFSSRGHGSGDEAIRVLQINALTSNPHADEVLRLISDPSIDIISLIECPVKLSRAIRADKVLADLNRVEGARNPPFTQWILLLSRWPMDTWESHAASTPGLVSAVVHGPDGPIGVVALHAAAPWEPPRWRVGNATIKGAARVAAEMRLAGLPVMVVGDLNSTPLGARTSWLRKVGLKRCKPALAAAGTFPSALPWPFQIAIDDAAVSEEIRVQQWETFSIPGSDHLGLSMDLVVQGLKTPQ